MTGVFHCDPNKQSRGGSVTLGMDVPAEDGGKSRNANVGFGSGDLGKDGFNVFGFLDMSKTDQITREQCPSGQGHPVAQIWIGADRQPQPLSWLHGFARARARLEGFGRPPTGTRYSYGT